MPGKILRFGSAHGEGGYQTVEVLECDLAGKVNTRESGCGQQLREATFRLTGFKGRAIEQQSVVRHTQQESGVSGLGQALLQFFPGRLKLPFGAFVFYPV